MIEVVYNKSEEIKNSGVLKLPKNIRQFGENNGLVRVYIEDYAYCFVTELPKNEKTHLGVLFGDVVVESGIKYLFIRSAYKLDTTIDDDFTYTEEIWGEIYEKQKKYFEGQNILGWYVSGPTLDDNRLNKLKKVHTDNFAGGEKTLFVYDMDNDNKTFFIYDDNKLNKISGYIVYYEKNESMQNYLVEIRKGTKTEDEHNERVKGNFRKILQERKELSEQKNIKSGMISYVANAAMVVMILFIGMYMAAGNKKNTQRKQDVIIEQSLTKQSIEVVTINGNVFPTEIKEEIQVETGEAKPEETTIEENNENTLSVPEEKNQSQLVVNAGVTEQKYVTYEVQKGDTLISISKKVYGNTSKIDEILKINDIRDRNHIYEGQIIKLP